MEEAVCGLTEQSKDGQWLTEDRNALEIEPDV